MLIKLALNSGNPYPATTDPWSVKCMVTLLKEKGAVYGAKYGWERANWFAPEGYQLDQSELGSGDVLLNHNHAPPLERKKSVGSVRGSPTARTTYGPTTGS